jgi:hypothetical protein
MVLLTILFFIIALVLFIIGISCFFTFFGYLDPIRFPGINARHFLNLGISCNLVVLGLAMVYVGMRKLLLQLVMERGVILTQKVLPFRNTVRFLDWSQIVDYYVVPDYPNVTFTFIVQEPNMRFERQSIKVPVYLKDEFQAFLDKRLQSADSSQAGSERSNKRYSSEN